MARMIIFTTQAEAVAFIAAIDTAMGWPNKYVMTWQKAPIQKDALTWGVWYDDTRLSPKIAIPALKTTKSLATLQTEDWWKAEVDAIKAGAGQIVIAKSVLMEGAAPEEEPSFLSKHWGKIAATATAIGAGAAAYLHYVIHYF
jgi:hypothetical protein